MELRVLYRRYDTRSDPRTFNVANYSAEAEYNAAKIFKQIVPKLTSDQLLDIFKESQSILSIF